MALNEEGFEILKNISKELLFSGCSRDIVNDDGNTAGDIFELNAALFNSDEAAKIRYILAKPKPCGCLRLTRPIEKVERNKITQLTAILFDTICLLAFVAAAFYNQTLKIIAPTFYKEEEYLFILSSISLVLAILFYILTLTDPGYVQSRDDFIPLLERMLTETLHLDYVCIQCENLRPEKTRHCNYCNKCI
jgi:palmitoyltransferase